MQNRARDFLKKIAKLAPTMEENVPSILIVSHGGLIRRMCGIIFQEMKCDLPTGISEMPDFKAARPLNTSFSRFKVDICTENYEIKTMKCETLFNSDHLNALAWNVLPIKAAFTFSVIKQ